MDRTRSSTSHKRRPRSALTLGADLDAKIETLRSTRYPLAPRAALLRAAVAAGLPLLVPQPGDMTAVALRVGAA